MECNNAKDEGKTCSMCKDPKFVLKKDGTATMCAESTCLDTQYFDQTANECKSCDTNCLVCGKTSFSECRVCS